LITYQLDKRPNIVAHHILICIALSVDSILKYYK